MHNNSLNIVSYRIFSYDYPALQFLSFFIKIIFATKLRY